MNKRHQLMAGALIWIASASAALAHHVMDNALPGTFVQGLLSGMGHPVIGIDHLAFVVGVGIAAAFSNERRLAPLTFVVATLVGCLFTLTGTPLPMTELVIAASVALLGVAILAARHPGTVTGAVFFAAAGLFHGYAYGESIVGAENTPVLAYLIGFVSVQYLICVSVVHITRSTRSIRNIHALQPRLAGAVIAGIGIAILVENVETLLFT